MGRFICCWRTMADDNEVAEEAEEAYAEELREVTQTRCPASLTPRSPCLTSQRSSPRPSHLRLSPAVVSFSNPFASEAENLYCAAAASFRTSPLSFRTSPSPTSNYLRIDDGTSPTSSRLMAHSPNPSNPCSSILHLSGLLDPSLMEKMPAQEGAEENPRTPLPHHTCSLCSLIRRHDRASPVSSGSLASRVQRDVGKGNFSAAAPSSTEEEEEGHCKCTEDNQSPLPSPTSPPSVRSRPVLAPYFPPSPPVQEIGEGSSHKADDLQASVGEVSDPVEYQYLTVKRTLDTLLQKRRSPSAMVRASHASLSVTERLI